MALGPDPADLYVWRDDGSGSEFAKDESISGRITQQWNPHSMAQEAALKIANSKLRCPLARDQSFVCGGVSARGAVSSNELAKWRGPAFVLDVDGAGATVKFQGQTLRAARYCARKRSDPEAVGDVEWDPAFECSEDMKVWPS